MYRMKVIFGAGGLEHPLPTLALLLAILLLGAAVVACENVSTEAAVPAATPTPETEAVPFVAVSSGAEYSCTLREDGSVACWGRDDSGKATPPHGAFASVSVGLFHSCGVKEDGSVTCWGRDDSGKPRLPKVPSLRSAPGFSTPAG